MDNSLVLRLIRKDLYLNRWLIALAIVGAYLSFIPARTGTFGFFFGLVMFITILIVFGLFVGMEGVTRESREKISVFVQSLPISPTQYMVAKVAAALIAFGSVWALMTVSVVAITLMSDELPNGGIPPTVCILGLLLSNFCMLLAIGVITHSPRWTTGGIIITNTSITLVMVALFNHPQVQATIGGTEAVWNPVVQICLAIEAFIIVASFATMLYVHSRRTDFI